ncbi:MAG TPA: hypothetical protein ENK25_02915 [Bacteroidetes bacterium]|nr:hypothetical protein [Bacteroidota bacterium]
MTGKLHLPTPAMILAGPAYRREIGFMTWLFLSTIILNGPALCSHLCYMVSLDYFLCIPQEKAPCPEKSLGIPIFPAVAHYHMSPSVQAGKPVFSLCHTGRGSFRNSRTGNHCFHFTHGRCNFLKVVWW